MKKDKVQKIDPASIRKVKDSKEEEKKKRYWEIAWEKKRMNWYTIQLEIEE